MKRRINLAFTILIIVICLPLSVNSQGYNYCYNFSNIDVSNIGNTTLNQSFAGGEIWYTFKIPAGLSNREVILNFTNNGSISKLSYSVYGPFDGSFSCTNLGSSIKDDINHFLSVVSNTSDCITYQESQRNPHVKFTLNSISNDDRYYVLKVNLAPGEFSNQQNINISNLFTLSSLNSTSTTHCSAYSEGVSFPCETNIESATPITICSDFTQTQDCVNCGFGYNSNRFYVLNILNSNTTISVNSYSFNSSHLANNTIFSLSNQMLYGPTDPGLLLPSNLLGSQVGGTFSYTFTTPGLYLLSVAIAVECPIIDIDFDNVNSNCEIIDCPQNTNCDNPLEICETTTQTVDCNLCGSYHNQQLFYELVVTNPNQVVNFTVESNTSQGFLPSNFAYDLWFLDGALCPGSSGTVNLANQNNINSGTYTFLSPGVYLLVLSNLTDCPHVTIEFEGENTCLPPPPCENCIGSFAPLPSLPGTESGRYLIGAWTKEINAPNTKVDYDQPEIYIDFTLDDGVNPPSIATVGPFKPQGAIIDGWQRIEEELIIPELAVDMEIKLTTVGDDVLFDDIRFFPFDASMKTFVYDPINMRLAAELDERHYATFYEYDEEGKLVRIKKETEKGIMTIQETKSNSSKKNP